MKQRGTLASVSRAAIGVALLATAVTCFSPVVVNAPSSVHSYSALQKQAETLRPKASAWRHTVSSTPVSLRNHRHSSADWLYNIRSIPSSTILKEVRHPVLAVFAWSTIVTFAHRALLRSASPATQVLGSGLHMSGVAHSFLVSALGLLLVFRTNSAYQRFQVR
jgi:Bestrophin, RFP-TM, chloride channel